MLHPTLLKAINPRSPYVYRPQIIMSSLSGSDTDKFIVQDYDFVCTRIRVSAFYDAGANAKRIIPTDSATDLTRIHLRRTGGGTDLMQEPIDIQAFNETYGDEFSGFALASKSEIVVEISNEIIGASNYSLPLTIDVAFFGYHTLNKALGF